MTDKMNAAPLNCKTTRKTAPKNVMIVDLLRNDLGKIAQTGKVRVPEPFKVSRFGRVWQMTSAIEAQALADVSVADINPRSLPVRQYHRRTQTHEYADY